MSLYTIQLSKWRIAKANNVKFIDITVKSGSSVFSPTWDMVLASKSGAINEDEYIDRYVTLLCERLSEDKKPFDDLHNDIISGDVAVACYCRSGKFCHRNILVQFMQSLYDIEYKGEIS